MVPAHLLGLERHNSFELICLNTLEHPVRNETMTIRLYREQGWIAKDTNETQRPGMSCAGTEVLCEELRLFYGCGAME
jgi:hypothetical protein